jgi:hypothetical protein
MELAILNSLRKSWFALTPSIPLSQGWARGKQDQSLTFSPSPFFWEKGPGDEGKPRPASLEGLMYTL